MNINLGKAKDDLEVTDNQIVAMTEEIARLNTELADLVAKRGQLESFIQLCDQYAENPSLKVDRVTMVHEGTDRPAKRPPAAPPKLDRDPQKQQTKIAVALAQRYHPGEILTSHGAAETTKDIITDTSGVQPQHFIVNYMTREALAVNGIVERVDRGRWRLRDDAVQRATVPPA